MTIQLQKNQENLKRQIDAKLQLYYTYLNDLERVNNEIELILYDMNGVKAVDTTKVPTQSHSDRGHMLLVKGEKLNEKEKEKNAISINAQLLYYELYLQDLNHQDEQILRLKYNGASFQKIADIIGYADKSKSFRRYQTIIENIARKKSG